MNKKSQNELVSSLSLLKNEIELDGRRLVVKEVVSKDDAKVIKEKQVAEQKRKKEEEDKRNLGMAKEGMLMEENWIHQKPAPSKQQMELR